MNQNVKFYSLNGRGIIPSEREKLVNGYYSLYSPEYLSLGSFEVKELDFHLGLEFSPGYFGFIKLSYDKDTGLLIILNNTIESQRCSLKLTLLNVMYDPNSKGSSFDALFGSRQRITINPKDEVAKLYIVKYE